MPTPNSRGTTDILWSCLSTVFLCVWTVIHLPVPCYRRKSIKFSKRTWRKWLRRKIVASKMFPALISIIVPELMVFAAVVEGFWAEQTRKDCPYTSTGSFSFTHSFFLNMGGFCLRSRDGRCRQFKFRDPHVLGTSLGCCMFSSRAFKKRH